MLHSRVAKVLSFPPLAFLLYVVSPWALYFTSWYDASLSSPYVHEMMHVHLVAVGALFFWPLMGIDPLPGRVGLPVPGAADRDDAAVPRLPGRHDHGPDALIGEAHYLALREGPMGAWLPPALEDQHVAGGILWAAGDLIGLVFFAVLFVQWVRSSHEGGRARGPAARPAGGARGPRAAVQSERPGSIRAREPDHDPT